MSKRIVSLFLVFVLLVCCTGCSKSKSSDQADQVDAISLGETFSDANQVAEGTMTFTVNSAEVSNNMKELGVDPYALSEYKENFVFYYDEAGNSASIEYPDYVDLDTGELKDGVAFVLVDITATNVDATSKTVGDGSGDFSSDYMFLPSTFHLSNLAQKDMSGGKEQSTYLTVSSKWYSKQADGYMYELRPGESLTFQIGFLVRCGNENYGSLYLTNVSMLDLRIPNLVLVDLGLGTDG